MKEFILFVKSYKKIKDVLSDLGKWTVIPVEGTKFDLLVEDMKKIAEQITNWTELKSCRCSQHSLKETIYYANKWEIWEKFRWVLNGSEYAINALAKYLANQ